MSRQIAGYGWRPSLPDPRDLIADPFGLDVKPEVDPRAQMPAVEDQGQLGSCTANAIAGAIAYDDRLNGGSGALPSRLDIYWGERKIEGSLGHGDTGAFGRDGFKWAHTVGTIPEAEWPYKIAKFEETPPLAVERRKIGAYKAVRRSLHDFKRVLSNQQTIAFGFSVYESFESPEVARTGIVPVPDPTHEQMLGGHEVLLVGYLADHPEHALVRNSWGTGWGIGGYCLMPWQILLDRSLSSDFRTIYRPASA